MSKSKMQHYREWIQQAESAITIEKKRFEEKLAEVRSRGGSLYFYGFESREAAEAFAGRMPKYVKAGVSTCSTTPLPSSSRTLLGPSTATSSAWASGSVLRPRPPARSTRPASSV